MLRSRSHSKKITFGIDFGTTNSVVAIMEGDQPKVLINISRQVGLPLSALCRFTERVNVLDWPGRQSTSK